MYLVDTWIKYIKANELDVYGEKKIDLPLPEVYVVYTGNRKTCPEFMSLKVDFFEDKEEVIDLKVKILYGTDKGGILDHYIL